MFREGVSSTLNHFVAQGKEKEEYERRQKLKRAIVAGDKIPKNLKSEENALRREMQLYGKEVRSLIFVCEAFV